MYSATPHLDGVRVETLSLDLGRTLTYLPRLAERLPPTVSLAGSADLSVRGKMLSATPTVEVDLKLDGAQIVVPGFIRKTPGVPLNLGIVGRLGDDHVGVQLKPLAWGPLTLDLEGTVAHDGALALAGSLNSTASSTGQGRAALRLSGPLKAPTLSGPAAKRLQEQLPEVGAGPETCAALERLSAPREPAGLQPPSPR